MAVSNVERFLAEAMDSVLVQSLEDFELIVADFGSKDGSRGIAAARAAADGRVRVADVAPCPLPEARNAACQLARGRYLAVMDADDLCMPDRLLLQSQWLDAHPDYAVLGGTTQWIDAAGRPTGLHSYPADAGEIRRALETRFPFCHPALMIRREAFEAVGGYRASFQFAHDYDLALRLSERYLCSNLSETVLCYRIHASQVSFLRQEKQTLCRLAAQASREARRAGRPDLLDQTVEIDETLILSLGVAESKLRSIQMVDARRWIRGMLDAGEAQAVLEMLAPDAMWRAPVERWQIADLHLLRARALRMQRRQVASMAAVARALVASPRVAGRFLRRLFPRVAEEAHS